MNRKKLNYSKLVFLSMALLFMNAALASTAYAYTNLILNPGFENGLTTPQYWEINSINGNIPVSDTVSHSGSRSIKISLPETTAVLSSGNAISSYIAASPSEQYNFSAWGKTSGIAGSAVVYVVEADMNSNWITEHGIVFGPGTEDWTKREISFSTSSDTKSLYVVTKIEYGYGTFWVDDIELSMNALASSYTSPANPIPIINDGFENAELSLQNAKSTPTGNTYYVAKNGDDTDPGTEMQPWLTIQKAANAAVAGDTVYVKAGTYSEQVIFPNSGTPGNYITFQNYSNDIVKVTTPIQEYDNIIVSHHHSGNFEIIGQSYIKIKGFTFTTSGAGARSFNCGASGDELCTTAGTFSVEGLSNNIIIDGNTFYDIDMAAINAGYYKLSSDQYAAWDISFINNYVYRSNSDEWVELISFDHVNSPIVSNNLITYQGNGEGILYKNGVDNGIISNNIVSNVWHPKNGKTIKWPGIYLDAYVNGVNNNRVFGNIVSNAAGALIGSEQGGLAQNNMFYNNILFDNDIGIGFGNSARETNFINNSIINNIVYNTSWESYFGTSGTGNIFRNNIKWGSGRIKISSNIQDHNSWDNIDFDPKFVNAAAHDFHLQSNSSAIDVGSSSRAPSTDFAGNYRPKEGGYDIGAFEN